MPRKVKLHLVPDAATLLPPSTQLLRKRTRSVSKPSAGQSIDMSLADSELRYRRLFETAKDGILIIDAETGMIIDANPYLLDMLGYHHSELLGRTLWEIGMFKDVVASREAFFQLQTRQYVRYENLPLETKSHEPRQVEFISNLYLVAGAKVIQCNIRDIAERKTAETYARKINEDLRSLVDRMESREEGLREQANRDALTGLFNRRYLDDSLPRELSLAWRRSTSLSLALLDIDHFKGFNDTFGHEAGDVALRECAHVLSRNLRKGDIPCRLGGDEFVLVLPDSSIADTRERVEQICALIAQVEMRNDERSLGTMTVSVGIATSPEHAFTARDLLRAADSALYAAKQNGRGQIILYEPAK